MLYPYLFTSMGFFFWQKPPLVHPKSFLFSSEMSFVGSEGGGRSCFVYLFTAHSGRTVAEMEPAIFFQVTNHVTRDASSGQIKPALGHSWSFVPSTRVLLENVKESCGKTSGCRIVLLTKSPRQVRSREDCFSLIVFDM